MTSRCMQFIFGDKSYLADQRVSYLWLKKRGRERGIWASAIGWNMDTQGIFRFASIQLPILLPNVCEVNREDSCLTAASSVCDSTIHNEWMKSLFSLVVQLLSMRTSYFAVYQSLVSMHIYQHEFRNALSISESYPNWKTVVYHLM